MKLIIISLLLLQKYLFACDMTNNALVILSVYPMQCLYFPPSKNTCVLSHSFTSYTYLRAGDT